MEVLQKVDKTHNLNISLIEEFEGTFVHVLVDFSDI